MQNKTILVKIGGEVAESEETSRTLLQDLVALKNEGHRVILCHGGGPQITRELKARGVEAKFVNGQRVTDAETLKLTCQILLGEINTALVSQCNREGNYAVGLSGVDACLYFSKQRDPSLGFVGKIEEVNTGHISAVLDSGLIPIVASLGIGEGGQIYNINADSAAGDLAAALFADYYLVFTNVEGLYRDFADKESLINVIDVTGLEQLLNKGALSEGMIPKIESIITALKEGVVRAVIVDGRKEHAVLNTVKALEQGKEIYGTVVGK